MTILHVEHPISEFTAWKSSFDRYASLRQECRVRSYEIHQKVDDPTYVMIRLELDSVADANALVVRLRDIWGNREATPALRGTPQVTILERKERTELG
jgi:hypothetical protein